MSFSEGKTRKTLDGLFLTIIAEAILLTVLFVGLYLRWGTGRTIGETPWYIPMTHSFAGLAAFSVAFLALGRYNVLRAPASYWIGMAFATFGILSIFFVLTWPGLLYQGRGVISRSPNTSGWMAVLELSTLGTFLIAADLIRWPRDGGMAGRRWLWTVAAWLTAVILTATLSVLFEQRLPPLVGPMGTLAPLLLTLDWVFLLLFAVGAVLSTRRYRVCGDTLLGYVAISQIATAFVIITALIGAKRYDVWYYLSRVLLVGGFLAMMFGLLSEYVQLFRRERDRTAEALSAEEELRRLATTLEDRVNARTAQLETTNKELEAFSYSVSHDLRAPLRIIDGFSHALAEDYSDRLDEEGKEDIKFIRESAQKMGQLIDDLLRLSRIGRAEMHFDEVNLSEIAQTIADGLQKQNPDRNVALAIQPNIITLADPDLIRIALENLLSNAWKFTSKAPSACIEFGETRRDDERVYFVKDNGAGFDMAYADRLFTPFQRLHTEAEFPGTGIGLAIVRRIISRHGGRVWAEGEVGKGATFYFTLNPGGEET